jgi:hypothetical protein
MRKHSMALAQHGLAQRGITSHSTTWHSVAYIYIYIYLFFFAHLPHFQETSIHRHLGSTLAQGHGSPVFNFVEHRLYTSTSIVTLLLPYIMSGEFARCLNSKCVLCGLQVPSNVRIDCQYIHKFITQGTQGGTFRNEMISLAATYLPGDCTPDPIHQIAFKTQNNRSSGLHGLWSFDPLAVELKLCFNSWGIHGRNINMMFRRVTTLGVDTELDCVEALEGGWWRSEKGWGLKPCLDTVFIKVKSVKVWDPVAIEMLNDFPDWPSTSKRIPLFDKLEEYELHEGADDDCTITCAHDDRDDDHMSCFDDEFEKCELHEGADDEGTSHFDDEFFEVHRREFFF